MFAGLKISGDFIELDKVQQKGGKLVYAWGIEGNVDAENIVSNTFRVEWPYKSGKWQTYPEVDKAGWFTLAEAKKVINESQAQLLEELSAQIP